MKEHAALTDSDEPQDEPQDEPLSEEEEAALDILLALTSTPAR